MTKEKLIMYGKDYLNDLENACCDISDIHKEFVREAIKALEQKPYDDAISRQAVLELAYDVSEIDGEHYTEPCMVVDVEDIQKLPLVNPQEPNTEDWETEKKGTFGIFYRCSKCHELYHTKTNYCPNCGAKMEVDQ